MLPTIAKDKQYLTTRLLTHQQELLNFLFYSQYDIIYLTFEQKHAAYLEKKEQRDSRSLKLEEMKRHYEVMSEKLHIRILRFDIDLDREIYRLEGLWDALQIPYFHRYYFESYIYTAYYKNIPSIIQNQQKLCRQENHIYFAISRGITARQACLRNLKIKLAELTTEDVYEYIHVTKQKAHYLQKKFQRQKYEIQGYKVKHLTDDKQPVVWKTKMQLFFQCFSHLKKLTFYLIDLIIKWRQYVYSLTHDQKKQREHLTFYYHQDNYLLKILTDLSFMRVSLLGNFYEFSMRNDPFLLRPILALESKQNKTVDDEVLKALILPDEQEYHQIMVKLELLAKEYHNNIQKRRVYDLARNPQNKLLKRYEPMGIEDSPVRAMIDKANRVLSELPGVRSRSHVRLPSRGSPTKNISLNKASPVKTIEDSPGSTRKNPFQLRQGNSLKSFRVVEWKDRKKIDVLAISAVRQSMAGTIMGNRKEDRPSVDNFAVTTKNNETTMESPIKLSKIDISAQPSPPKTPTTLPLINPSVELVDSEALAKLKEQVVKRIKNEIRHDPAILQPSNHPQDDALKNIIVQELSLATKNMFPYQPPQKQTKQIQLITKSFKFLDLKSELLKIFKGFPQPYTQLQIPYEKLEELILNNLYTIILQAVLGTEVIGWIFCSLDTSDNTEFKRLRIQHAMSYNIGYLEQIILKSVDFLWKYENSFEIEWYLLTPTNNKTLVDFTQEITNKFSTHCLVVGKQAYSTLSENRLIFKRKLKNVNYLPNKYPNKVYINLRMLVSLQNLIDSNAMEFQQQNTLYQLLLAEVLRRYSTSQNIIFLKEKSTWRGKLKYVLDLLLKIQTGELKIQTKTKEMASVVQVNKVLKEEKDKLIELGDSKRENRVCLLETKLVLQFNQKLQCSSVDGLPYYKMTVDGKILAIKTDKLSGWALNAHNRAQRIFYMPAHDFIEQRDRQGASLLGYLMRLFGQYDFHNREIQAIWLPMHRTPKDFTERDEIYSKVSKLEQLTMIKKQLYYSEELEWFCNLNLQNGLEIEPSEKDIIIRKPYIMAILQVATPIYAQCII